MIALPLKCAALDISQDSGSFSLSLDFSLTSSLRFMLIGHACFRGYDRNVVDTGCLLRYCSSFKVVRFGFVIIMLLLLFVSFPVA